MTTDQLLRLRDIARKLTGPDKAFITDLILDSMEIAERKKPGPKPKEGI